MINNPNTRSVLAETLVRAAEPVISKGIEFAGSHLGNFLGGMYDTARDATYQNITNQVPVPPNLGGENPLVTKAGVPRKRSDLGELRPDLATGGVQAPHEAMGQQYAYTTKEPTSSWQDPFFNNPELTAKTVGALGPAAALSATGLFLNALNTSQSHNSLPVTRNQQYGGYNANVEAAAAKAFFDQEREKTKYENQVNLLRARQEARTPGYQGIPGMGAASPTGYTAAPPINEEINNIARSIYGSGFRM